MKKILDKYQLRNKCIDIALGTIYNPYIRVWPMGQWPHDLLVDSIGIIVADPNNNV